MRDQIEPVLLHLHKLESIESMKSVFCLIKHTWKRSDCHESIHHLHDMQTNIYILRALEALKNAAYTVSRNCACSNFCSESHNNNNTDFFYGPSMSNAQWAGELFSYTSSVTAARAWRWPSTILVKTSIRSFFTSPVNSFPVLYSCHVQPTNQCLFLPD